MVGKKQKKKKRPLLKFFSKSRSGLYSETEYDYYDRDRVVSKGALTLQDLGVTPADIAEPALSILRLYRRPNRKSVNENIA